MHIWYSDKTDTIDSTHYSVRTILPLERTEYQNILELPLCVLLIVCHLSIALSTITVAGEYSLYFLSFVGTPEVASDVHVACNSNEIIVSISTRSGRFNGMIYPRGLSKNSTCMGEWVQRPSPVQYTLPLRGCNTMSTELVSFRCNLIFCILRIKLTAFLCGYFKKIQCRFDHSWYSDVYSISPKILSDMTQVLV